MPNLDLLDDFTMRHLGAWYNREFPMQAQEAAEDARKYLSELSRESLEHALEHGWPYVAEKLNHYVRFR